MLIRYYLCRRELSLWWFLHWRDDGFAEITKIGDDQVFVHVVGQDDGQPGLTKGGHVMNGSGNWFTDVAKAAFGV